MFFENATKRPSNKDLLNPTLTLVDLVRTATCANRNGVGDLIWATWQPAGKGIKAARVTSISSGAMFLMLTPAGAKKIASAMQRIDDEGKVTPSTKERPMTPGHFDVQLKEYLMSHGRTSEDPVKYCYIFPPIGNYSTHPSGCDPNYSKGEGRPSCWLEKWCCQGTRKSQDRQKRDKYMCQLTRKGEPTWIGIVDVEEDGAKLNWKSLWCDPQEPPPRPNKQWQQLFGADDPRVAAIEPAGHVPLAGPPGARKGRVPLASPKPKQGKGQSARADVKQEDELDEPPEPKSEETRLSDRQRRKRGQLVFQRSLRYWTTIIEEPVCSK